MSRRKETKNDAERILKKVFHELKCQRVKEKADVLMTHLEKGRRINTHSFLTTKETMNIRVSFKMHTSHECVGGGVGRGRGCHESSIERKDN